MYGENFPCCNSKINFKNMQIYVKTFNQDNMHLNY